MGCENVLGPARSAIDGRRPDGYARAAEVRRPEDAHGARAPGAWSG